MLQEERVFALLCADRPFVGNMDATIKQDLPPKGGYRPINFSRNPAKSYIGGGKLLAGFAFLNGCALYYYSKFVHPKIVHEKVEKRGAYLATLPLLLAERDRAFLKQVRKNRDEEAKLMANVPNWEVGKLNDEPVYKTVTDDMFVEPTILEYYVHSPYLDYFKKAYSKHIQV